MSFSYFFFYLIFLLKNIIFWFVLQTLHQTSPKFKSKWSGRSVIKRLIAALSDLCSSISFFSSFTLFFLHFIFCVLVRFFCVLYLVNNCSKGTHTNDDEGITYHHHCYVNVFYARKTFSERDAMTNQPTIWLVIMKSW